MDFQAFAEWLRTCRTSTRITVLALIYSSLTVYTRELFLPDTAGGKEARVLEILCGLNELHHAIANQLVAYATEGRGIYTPSAFGQMLLEIAGKYRVANFLSSAVEFAQTRVPPHQHEKGDHGEQ